MDTGEEKPFATQLQNSNITSRLPWRRTFLASIRLTCSLSLFPGFPNKGRIAAQLGAADPGPLSRHQASRLRHPRGEDSPSSPWWLSE